MATRKGATSLQVAAFHGHLACVQYLLSLPAAAETVNTADEGGATAVHRAAQKGHVEVLAALVQPGPT